MAKELIIKIRLRDNKDPNYVCAFIGGLDGVEWVTDISKKEEVIKGENRR